MFTFTFFNISGINCSGLETCSTLTTPRNKISDSESLASGGTIPGQSIKIYVSLM